MEYQLNHHEIQNQKHDLTLKLLVEDLQHPSNYGMMIRMAETLGVDEVIFFSKNFKELSSKMKKSSRSAENFMKVRFSENIDKIISEFRHENYEIIGLEFTSRSENIKKLKFTNHPKVLICGNESFGLSSQVISNCDFCVHLPMYGENSSMNVVMATCIALWEIIG